MIQLTESASKELEAFFVDKPKSSIRIYLAPVGCRGPRLALALDEPKDDDSVEEFNGFTFCMQKDLLTEVKSVSIDLSYMGFVVEPEIPMASSNSACGSCASGGSCGV